MTSIDQDVRFQLALEECSRRVRSGELLEHCLSDYPVEYREELARLSPLTDALGKLGADPSLEFRDKLKQRLIASVQEERSRRRSGPGWFLNSLFSTGGVMRFATIAAIALVVLVGGGMGVVQASASSLPDSPLYQVKTAREWVQLFLARDEEAQVNVSANNIEERGQEIETALIAGKRVQVIGQVARRLALLVRQMDDRALDANAHGNPRPVNRALTAIRNMQQRVNALSSRASSPQVRTLLQRVNQFLRQEETRLLNGSSAST